MGLGRWANVLADAAPKTVYDGETLLPERGPVRERLQPDGMGHAHVTQFARRHLRLRLGRVQDGDVHVAPRRPATILGGLS